MQVQTLHLIYLLPNKTHCDIFMLLEHCHPYVNVNVQLKPGLENWPI